MYIVKDTNPEELKYLKSHFEISLSLDFENPTFYYTFKNNNNIIGYSEIKIENDITILKKFIIEKKIENTDKMFFLKGTGSKIFDLGFKSFLVDTDEVDFYKNLGDNVNLEELFVGTCNDK